MGHLSVTSAGKGWIDRRVFLIVLKARVAAVFDLLHQARLEFDRQPAAR